jgi:ferric-dicitrate binding protein FerR (iron transport regulator)
MKPVRDSIEALVRLAGERDRPSAAGMERARAAAHEAWQQSLREGRAAHRRSHTWLLALAASVVLAAAGVWWWQPTTGGPVVAHVTAVQGEILLEGGASDEGRLEPSSPVRAGSVLDTRGGRLALQMGDALSLRLDRGTRLRLVDAERVVLLQGALYVDSGGLNMPGSLRIDTPAGTVRHVGTQFQVRLVARGTRVDVREGRVVLEAAGRSVDVGAGDRVVAADGSIEVQHGIAGFGETWAWVATLAPDFAIDNRPLDEFLTWLAREQGWQLRYADPALQLRSREIRLHGSVAGLGAMDMLERVSLITGVPLVVEQGVLLAGAPQP